MASDAVPWVPMGSDASSDAAPQHEAPERGPGPAGLLDSAERFLAASGFDRAPWLAVAFAGGIGAWFALPDAPQWLALLALCGAAVAGGYAMPNGAERWPYLRQAVAAVALALALGCATVWAKSGSATIDSAYGSIR